ncbi:MAG: hypothetical protein FMNOHCHN_01049 [Ignavibacteriaceae bacterium]|nr:hypothetical protein [Ignavibacteriaceae bacterium]
MKKQTALKSHGSGPLLLHICVVLLALLLAQSPQYAQQAKMTQGSHVFGHVDSLSRNLGLRMQATVGNVFGINSTAGNGGAYIGLSGHFMLPPNSPVVTASQGEFPDKIELRWSFDVLSPPADKDYFKVYRDGNLLATLPMTQNYYFDYNVYPGTYYNYEVTGNNEFNESGRGQSIGFVNPNGVITGNIATQFGTPVHDVEVVLSPTVGKALYFDGINDYVNAGRTLNFANKSFSIEFWLKRPSPDTGIIFSQNYTSANANDPNRLSLGFAYPGNVLTGHAGVPFSVTITEDSAWHHYAWVQDNMARKGYIYRDSRLIHTYDLGTTVYTGTGTFEMGRSLTKYTHMYLDEMRVWGAVIDSVAIKRNMRRTVNTTSPNLLAYWKFDEGIGDRIFDLSPATNNGLVHGSTFSDETARVRTTAFTDTLGNYTIEGINYGASTNFSVIPSRDARLFNPPTRIVTLSSSNTAANNIDFTDVSQIPITGFVTHSETSCFVDSVEILVDGKSWNPRIYTNVEGKYIAEFEPGSTHTLTPVRKGYTFLPAFRQYQNIVDPIASGHFSQTEKFTFSGKIAGGKCDNIIGPSRIILESMPGCYVDTIETSVNGSFTISGLPPLLYRVSIQPFNPNITFDADTVSLKDTSQTKGYRYFSPLIVEVSGLQPAPNCDLVILDQFIKVPLRYKIYEQYTWDGVTTECAVDTVELTIYNDISDKLSNPRTLFAVNGQARDTIITGYPNIIFPFLKKIEVVATHEDGRQAQDTAWAVVTGIRPRTSAFTTTSPAIPILILRDPPGDGSFATMSSSTSVSNSISMYGEDRETFGMSRTISLAPDFTSETGFGFSVETEIDLTFDITGSMEYTQTGRNTRELATTITTSETFSTAGDGGVIGEEGDVFVGGAMNLTYGVTDVLEYNDSCGFRQYRSLVVSPQGFATTFIYTQDYIKNFVLPSLELIGDTTSIKSWNKILAYNDSLKRSAEFSRNLSFSAGTVSEFVETTEQTISEIFEFDMTVDASLAIDLGATFNGVGTVDGFTFTSGFSFGGSNSTSTTTSNTIGFTLTDDDPGDAFSVNVYKDKVYGTPVFELVAGQSSCPWEPGTVARDSMGLISDNSIAVNVHPDSFAVFNLGIQNLGQLGESREFQLRVINESNPNGAQIAVNGITLQGGLNYTVQPNSQINTVLTIKRGPQAYTYQDIALVLTSPCEWDQGAGGEIAIADTLYFSVFFLEPCSEIAVAEPGQNWLINTSNENDFNIKLFGYDRLDPNLQEVVLQYRPVVTAGKPVQNRKSELEDENRSEERSKFGLDENKEAGRLQLDYISEPISKFAYREVIDYSMENRAALLLSNPAFAHLFDGPENLENWLTIKTIPRDSLPPEFISIQFLTDGVADGVYEIRAVAQCGGGTISGTSALVVGRIDKTRPRIAGVPLPADGVLNPDDQISIIFTEDIECEGLNVVDNFAFINTQTGDPVDYTFACGGKTITFTPNVANRFIENKVLRMIVKGVKDKSGNIMSVPFGTQFRDSTAWEFLVDRNPVRWTGGEIEVVKYLDESAELQRQLINDGGASFPYTLFDFPQWMNVTPINGTVQSSGAVTVTFRFDTSIPTGTYVDTIYANTLNGDEPLIVKLRVLCRPPLWTINPEAFEFSMNMTAKLFIDTTASDDIYDRVAVYSGTQLRGIGDVSRISNTNQYRLFITVYSNTISGEALTFRVWDASGCIEYGQVMEQYSFQANSVLGDIHNPVPLTATQQILQPYSLPEGWTWLSFNTISADMSLNSVLSGGNNQEGDAIKDQSRFSLYVNNYGWVGTLDTIRPVSNYLWKKSAPVNFTRTGYSIRPEAYPVRVDSGWNWIGYIPQENLPVNAALQTLQPRNGDIIKSQFQFAIYDSVYGWFGNLQFMQPKLGYLIKLSRKDTLIYPSPVPGMQNLLLEEQQYVNTLETVPGWSVNAASYDASMIVVAALESAMYDSVSQTKRLGVFAGEECRGIAEPIAYADGRQLFMLTIYGMTGHADTLSFRVVDLQTGNIRQMSTILTFDANASFGSPQEPYIIPELTTSADEGNLIPEEFMLAQNYPNPFNPTTTIKFGLPVESNVRITIYDMMGAEILVLQNGTMKPGYHSMTWDGRNSFGVVVPSGVYIYSMQADKFNQSRKLIFLK